MYTRYTKTKGLRYSEKFNDLAKSNNLKPSQMALSFVFSIWFVTSTIVGATSMNQLKENLSAYKIGLPDDILEKIDSVHLKTMNPAP